MFRAYRLQVVIFYSRIRKGRLNNTGKQGYVILEKIGSVTINFCSQHTLGVIAHIIFFPLSGALLLVLQFLPACTLVLPAAGCCCPSGCLMGVEPW